MFHESYMPMFHGNGTVYFGQMSSKLKNRSIKDCTDEPIFKRNDFSVYLNTKNLSKPSITARTHKLFDVLVILLTAQNAYKGSDKRLNTEVQFELRDYLTLCGVPTTKSSHDEQRKLVKKDLETLTRISLEWSERDPKAKTGSKSGPGIRNFSDVWLFNMCEIDKRGIITADFTPELTSYLTSAYVTYFPLALFKLKGQSSNSYYIGKKLAHYFGIRKNIKHGKNDIIGITSLLDATPDILPYADLTRAEHDSGHWQRRIRQPLEKSLDVLRDIGIIDYWDYCSSGKQIIPMDTLPDIAPNYLKFSKLYICFGMKNHPALTKTGAA